MARSASSLHRPFLPDSNVFALACNYRWSNWLRHEVSSWRLVLSRTCEAACRRFSGGSIVDMAVTERRIESAEQVRPRTRTCIHATRLLTLYGRGAI